MGDVPDTGREDGACYYTSSPEKHVAWSMRGLGAAADMGTKLGTRMHLARASLEGGNFDIGRGARLDDAFAGAISLAFHSWDHAPLAPSLCGMFH